MKLAAEVGAAGAHGGMTDIDFDWARRTRQLKEELDMYSRSRPSCRAPTPASFEHAVKVAKEAGATQPARRLPARPPLRAMATLDDWKRAVAGFHQQIAAALPDRRAAQDAARHREPQGLARRSAGRAAGALQQRVLGVCLDTGNNLAVLDDPIETVEKLAPWTFNVHFKDMAMEECDDGFLLSEVPLGEGMLDMPRIVDIIRRARPEVRFSLEMITRDPLLVPCLTDRYWASFDDENGGRDLARMLTRIRAQPAPGAAAADLRPRRRTSAARSSGRWSNAPSSTPASISGWPEAGAWTRMDPRIRPWVEKVWDYHHLNHELQPSDAILVLCSHDTVVAERGARLFLEGWAPRLIFSGGQGAITSRLFTEPEAERFASIAVETRRAARSDPHRDQVHEYR